MGMQADYYGATAADYESMHPFDELEMAVAMVAGFARQAGVESILDVGAGTGRVLNMLREYLPEVRLMGIEPVAALREVGYSRGIDPAILIEGSGDALPFEDGAFDLVIETGVLHHVPDPAKMVREMVRVAGSAVVLCDSNNFGQGSRLVRLVKRVLRAAGLWRVFIWVTTRGQMSKYSEGDGVFYSYSLFDNLPDMAAKFPRQCVFNTSPLNSLDFRHGAPEAVVIGYRKAVGGDGLEPPTLSV